MHRIIVFFSSNDIPVVENSLKVTNVFPLQGSLVGGVKVTITGSGFGVNDTLVEVKAGDVECEVTMVTDTQIQCDLDTSAQTHVVTNEGSHPGRKALTFLYSSSFCSTDVKLHDLFQDFLTCLAFLSNMV